MPSSDGQVSERITNSVRRGVASSEAEAEVKRVVEGLGGEASSEVEIAPQAREGALDGPYCGAGPWAECELGLFEFWRGLWALLRKLKPPSNPSFRSDRRKTAGLGLSRLTG